MKTCNCCGATENQINVSTYKAIGILNNKLETVKLDICDCCSSWSVMQDDERICKLTGFDYVLSDYMTEDIITQIADYMVKIVFLSWIQLMIPIGPYLHYTKMSCVAGLIILDYCERHSSKHLVRRL